MSIKQIVATTLFALFYMSIYAQGPNWQWAKSPVGDNHDRSSRISTDAKGNVYVTGSFSSEHITFGTTTLTNTSASLGYDIFIVKYDAAGNVIWAKSAGGDEWDEGLCISTDLSGSVLVTGYFESPVITFGTTTLTKPNASADIFVVKYDSLGNVLWAKSTGGTFCEEGSGITTDVNGNVYVTGFFESPSITFGTITLTNAGNLDLFVVKYDAVGNVVWAKSSNGGTSDELGKDISTDPDGNVLVTGNFNSSSISFGTIILSKIIGYDTDIFVVKYDSLGNVIWAKSVGASDYESSIGITTNLTGNIYITGSFWSDSITFGTTTLVNAGNMDLFVVKYDATGTVLWAKSAGGDQQDFSSDITIDVSGNVYLTGFFWSDSITFGTTTLNNVGWSDIFFAKYDFLGNSIWAISKGGNDIEGGKGITSDSIGSVYVTGIFKSPSITFGTTILTNTNTNSTFDIFVAKLNSITAIDERNTSDYEINIFPNPFSSYSTIHSSIFLENTILTIYNIHGQAVQRITSISGRTILLNRDNLPNGLYLIRLIENNNVILSDKIVIKE